MQARSRQKQAEMREKNFIFLRILFFLSKTSFFLSFAIDLTPSSSRESNKKSRQNEKDKRKSHNLNKSKRNQRRSRTELPLAIYKFIQSNYVDFCNVYLRALLMEKSK